MIESITLNVYRSVARALMKVFRKSSSAGLVLNPRIEGEKLAWFHAASVGELESLRPVIRAWSALPGHSIGVTVFSRSADEALAKLRRELSEAKWVGCGESPLEGNWSELLSRTRPNVFVCAKYEAWPDLWCSLIDSDIPLAIVAARVRGSLRIAGVATRFWRKKTPRIVFLTSTERDSADLMAEFRTAKAILTGDPRWDRVFERIQQGNPRARSLKEAAVAAGFPRPWGVFGSLWSSDLEVAGPALSNWRGTPWVVPHVVEPDELESIERFLIGLGWRVLRVSRDDLRQAPPGGKTAILVDEMGYLSELYSGADWAFVGGGFGRSLHSTIEPAIAGIPIAAGPEGAERFAEVSELQGWGQLTLVGDTSELRDWLKAAEKVVPGERDCWKREVEKRLGAAERVFAALLSLAGDASSKREY